MPSRAQRSARGEAPRREANAAPTEAARRVAAGRRTGGSGRERGRCQVAVGEGGVVIPIRNITFRTAEVARFAEVSLRQLQIWEEKKVAVASRCGRVRVYDANQAVFVVVCAELRRRGLSFQRLHRLAPEMRQILADHAVADIAGQRQVFLLTDGRQIYLADSPNII